MKGKCVVGTLVLFAGGVCAGLYVAAQTAKQAGCPAAKGVRGAGASNGGCGERVADAARELADAADDLVHNLEGLCTRGAAGGLGGSTAPGS